jgi:outer membrane protein assembly factor BamB
MHNKILGSLVALTVAAIPSFNASAADASKPSPAPLLSILDRFTAADVPAFAPTEAELLPGRWTNAAPAPVNLPGKGLAQHSMLYLGEGYNKLFVVHGGKVIWTFSTGKGGELDDAWMLSNGNIVFSRMRYVAEVTPKKKIIWRYDCPTNTEVHCCQPIGLDKVLFVRNGLPPKLMVVNIKTKAVEVEHDLPAIEPPDPKKIHPQFRRVRYTAAGTYLVPFLNMGKVVEYDKTFKELWSYEIKSPWAAIRLKNGNTLISDESDKLVREVNSKGQTVWELKPDDLPAPFRYPGSQTCTRLANGNTIICSRGGNGQSAQLIEVSPDKKVVWALQDWKDLGPATAVQILDDPGIPENPGESEH